MGEVDAGGALDRRAVVTALLADRSDLLVVSGLGSASYDVMAAGDHDNTFYLWAAMGSAVMVGLGLASAQPGKSVLVVTGDGEALMGLGALATVSLQRPANLTIAILDNGHYGETGMQVSHTGKGLRLDRVAEACGFPWTAEIRDMEGVEALRHRLRGRLGLSLAAIKIKAEDVARVLPPRDGVYVKNRFRSALGLRPL